MSEMKIIPVQPLSADIIDTMLYEQGRVGSVQAYTDHLGHVFRRSVVRRALADLSDIVEPEDRILGIDSAKPHADAFYRGGLLGLRAVSACTADIDAAFGSINLIINNDVSVDDPEIRHQFAEYILDLGRQGYAINNQVFTSLFEHWDYKLLPDATYHRYLHSGFGLPIIYLSMRAVMNDKIDHELAHEQMEQAVANPDAIDWEQLLE